MKNFIELLESKYNEYLERINDTKKSSKLDEMIKICETIISSSTYYCEDFEELISPYMEYIKNQKDKDTIKYLSAIFKFNHQSPNDAMYLDASQVNIFKSLLEELKIVKKNNESYKDLKYLEEIIKDLKEGIYFTNIDGLRRAFEDLQIELPVQKDILFYVISHNIEKSKDIDKIPENKSKLDAISVEMSKENRNDEKTENISSITRNVLNPILNKYGIIAKDFSAKYYILLQTYGNINNIDSILKLLRQNMKLHDLFKDGEGYVMTKILLQSSVENIEKVLEICQNNNYSFSDFVTYNPDVLISPREDIILKNDDGYYLEYSKIEPNFANFISNVSFFEEKNLDVGLIMKKASNIVKYDSNQIQRTFNIMKNYYNLYMDEKSLTFLRASTSISSIDLLYEILPNAKEFIEDQKSFLFIGNKADYNAIKFFNNEENPIVIKSERTHKYSFNKKILESIKSKYVGQFDELNKRNLITDREASKNIESQLGRVNLVCEIDFETLSQNEYLSYLESNFKINDQVYLIRNEKNGVETRISRVKVFRVCQKMMEKGINIDQDAIIYALSYKSLLTENDVYNIDHYRELGSVSRGNGGV